jgi:pyrimidine-nucleoside phosphorylase
VDALVMDVKLGSGAFLPQEDDARRLARTLVAIGREVEMPVVALLTDMNQPLGRAIGNATEVVESIETLKGAGPDDLREIVLALGAEMLVLGDAADSIDEARKTLAANLDNHKGLEKFVEMVTAHDGNAKIVDDPSVLGIAELDEETVKAERTGVVAAIDTRQVGLASMVLGVGRQMVEDEIDHSVSIQLEKKIGERVEKGEVLWRVRYRSATKMERACQLLAEAVTLGDEAVDAPPLLKGRIDVSDLDEASGDSRG